MDRAAEPHRAAVVILVSPSSFTAEGGERLVRAFGSAVISTSAEVLVHLDHARDERLIERAADCGVDAVMADGSRLPFAENLAFTRTVAGSMQPRSIGVEAELGRVEGHEGEAGETPSGADCLAVGNIHGRYSGTPNLDWWKLDEIRGLSPATLSLHGPSGLPEGDLRRAVSLGVVKLNVNAALRVAYFGFLEDEFGDKVATLNPESIGDGVVEAKLSTFGWTRTELYPNYKHKDKET